jgi:hypothetical protein
LQKSQGTGTNWLSVETSFSVPLAKRKLILITREHRVETTRYPEKLVSILLLVLS